MRAIDIVMKHFDSYSAAARAIGTSPQMVNYWFNSDKSDLPIDLFPAAARAIKKHPSELRPDIFIDFEL